MADETEKIASLERVRYELAMLNYTFMRIVTAQSSTPEEQLDRNAFLESFAVHARNLVRFLCAKAEASVRNASDYVADFEAPDQTRLARPRLRLEQQILNITAGRTTDPKSDSVSMTHGSFIRGSCRQSSSSKKSSPRIPRQSQCPWVSSAIVTCS